MARRMITSEPPTAAYASKIEALALDQLRPYRGNARTHSAQQIREIARSIERFGFTNPVLIDRNHQIIAGHGRVAAARLLGLAMVPTLMLEHLSEAETRAYILADNRLAEKAGWDRDLLAIELQGLMELDFDVSVIGFDTAEIDLLFEEAARGSTADTADDVIPAYAAHPPGSRPGDLWLLGEHRLLCGDARDPHVYQQLLAGERAQFVFTDPPYNVPIDGHVCGLGRIRHKDFAMGCGEMDAAAFTAFLASVFQQLAKHSLDGSIHDICMDWRHMGEMLAAGHQAYSELKNLCVWNKPNAGMGTFQEGERIREKNSATVFDHLPLPGGLKIGDLNNGELANVLIKAGVAAAVRRGSVTAPVEAPPDYGNMNDADFARVKDAALEQARRAGR